VRRSCGSEGDEPLEVGLCHLLQLSEADAAFAGGDHRAAPVHVRDLRQLDPVSALLESRNSKNSRLWGQPFTIENMLDMLEAAITCPPSKSTLAKLREAVEAETAFRRGNGEQ
jgi:hypothetical protein